MDRKALVVIDIQNDITKHWRDIIDRIGVRCDVKEGRTVWDRTGQGRKPGLILPFRTQTGRMPGRFLKN